MTGTHKTYDVFLSFRGEDTRKGFTDHLWAALCRAGFKTFRDDEEIPRTESINLTIQKAISGSRMAIIVFSENFASSVWCLTEVAMLMERRSSAGLIVLPVFYKVEPCKVREQKGRYGEALAQHKLSCNDESIKLWKNSLQQAADLGGMVLGERYESPFIGSIIKEVGKQLNYNLSDIAGDNPEIVLSAGIKIELPSPLKKDMKGSLDKSHSHTIGIRVTKKIGKMQLRLHFVHPRKNLVLEKGPPPIGLLLISKILPYLCGSSSCSSF